VPSKKRSNTSRSKKPHKTQFFIDRNLGGFYLAEQLRSAGFDVRLHDDFYQQTERDPLIFYECGVKGWVVVTSDTGFMKAFPHMAAVALGNTTVIAFTNNNYKSAIRGNAFIATRKKIEAALKDHRGRNFIAVVGIGTFRICAESPLPSRKLCDPRDWQSYEGVCQQAGVLPFAPKH
jgi:nucleoside-diphosphate-sugar epimerase